MALSKHAVIIGEAAESAERDKHPEISEYVKALSHLDNAARCKQWEIFQPDWDYLGDFPCLPLSTLVGLTIGLHPYFAVPDWILNRAIPYFEGRNWTDFPFPPNFPSAKQEIDPPRANKHNVQALKRFQPRLTVAVGNIAPYGTLIPVDGVVQAEKTMVSWDDFVRFAIQKGWLADGWWPLESPLEASAGEAVNQAARGERELTKWFRETWVAEGMPNGTPFFEALKKYVNQPTSPITEHYTTGSKGAGIRWSTGSASNKMTKKSIQTMVSNFKNQRNKKSCQ